VAQSNYRENTALPVKKSIPAMQPFPTLLWDFLLLYLLVTFSGCIVLFFLHSLKISLHVVLFAGILSMFCVHAGAKKGIFVFH